jgi:hypothetical protein
MYWLQYLVDKKGAGILDWQAIGGTWGAATSNLASWSPTPTVWSPDAQLQRSLQRINDSSSVLSRYVHKYFEDMALHLASLTPLLMPGAVCHYVVGNSKFYDELVPVEQELARLFERLGFHHITIETLRKRTSKKELYEYLVSATWA